MLIRSFTCARREDPSSVFCVPRGMNNKLLRKQLTSISTWGGSTPTLSNGPMESSIRKRKARYRIPGVCDNPRLVIKGVKGLVTKFGPCRFCGVKVKGLWGLRNHERTEHPEEFKWECPSCQKTFTEEIAISTCEGSHKETLETYQCGLCVLK